MQSMRFKRPTGLEVHIFQKYSKVLVLPRVSLFVSISCESKHLVGNHFQNTDTLTILIRTSEGECVYHTILRQRLDLCSGGTAEEVPLFRFVKLQINRNETVGVKLALNYLCIYIASYSQEERDTFVCHSSVVFFLKKMLLSLSVK